jgi:hypothetical protein
MDTMRKEFEAWWRREHGHTHYCESTWRGWQAGAATPEARERKLVELLAEILAEADEYTKRTGKPVRGWPERARQLVEESSTKAERPYTGHDPEFVAELWQGDAIRRRGEG